MGQKQAERRCPDCRREEGQVAEQGSASDLGSDGVLRCGENSRIQEGNLEETEVLGLGWEEPVHRAHLSIWLFPKIQLSILKNGGGVLPIKFLDILIYLFLFTV